MLTFYARCCPSWRGAPFSRIACRWKSARDGAAERRFQREQKLRDIYNPFEKLTKGSTEYQELAESGRVWENYFHPGDSKKLGYTALQRDLADSLEKIDNLKRGMSRPINAVAKALAPNYAHQSVQIEGNQLCLNDSVEIDNHLNVKLFHHMDLGKLPADKLTSLDIPGLLNTSHDPNQVAELTNHIVISRWIAEVASSALRTAGFNEDEVRKLSAATLQHTASEKIYTHGWGKRISLGDYRATPISVKFNHLRIFPYHLEVPALMKSFFRWRDQIHERKELHPLIAACQLIVYFLHIHPFPDGNGRVGRMIMHDYMVRQGYLPIVMINLERTDYLQMISNAQDGRPENFVLRVVKTQLDEMRTCRWRN